MNKSDEDGTAHKTYN